MNIDIFDFLTLRHVLWALLVLPLATMLVVFPFVHSLSKNTREWVGIFGLLGFIVNSVFAVEACYGVVRSIFKYLTKKPQVYFDMKTERMVTEQITFDSSYVIGVLIFFGIAFLTWKLLDYIYPRGSKPSSDEDVTTLGLNK
jgi:hypothetical protein